MYTANEARVKFKHRKLYGTKLKNQMSTCDRLLTLIFHHSYETFFYGNCMWPYPYESQTVVI